MNEIRDPSDGGDNVSGGSQSGILFSRKARKIKPVAIKCPALCRPTMMRRSRQPVFVSVQQFHADLAGALDSYFRLNILSV
jgi:hypothetical protein